ncbi:MAG: response regulator, partial [Methylococcaceae bacterium]|nr:response regulator [Methylococcaceae bacterium]
SRIKELSLITARNTQDAIKLAEDKQPDIIIMDTEFPDNSGIEAIQHLKSNPLTQSIPVLALGAASYEEISQNVSFEQYLTKPINVSEILKSIYSVLENKS